MAVIRLYRPSNGTDGAYFMNDWCCDCERDKDEDCDILARTLAFDTSDPEYPQEWRYGDYGRPCCTAFVERGKPVPPPKDELTLPLF